MSHTSQDEGEGNIRQWFEVLSKQELPQDMLLPGMEIVSKVANGVVVSIAYITGHIWGQTVETYQEDLVRAYSPYEIQISFSALQKKGPHIG